MEDREKLSEHEIQAGLPRMTDEEYAKRNQEIQVTLANMRLKDRETLSALGASSEAGRLQAAATIRANSQAQGCGKVSMNVLIAVVSIYFVLGVFCGVGICLLVGLT